MSQATPTGEGRDAPYCGNCGYLLTGLTDSSKCPECGRPLVEVLRRKNFYPTIGRRYRSKATLCGWPVIDIALGPAEGEMRGKARGVIAVGDFATGGIAVGGLARGIVAVGGGAVGVFAVGGGALGLLTAVGGLAVGGMAMGGCAIGILATGGGACGLYAQGGGGIGKFVRDSRSMGRPGMHPDPFNAVSWFFGPWPPTPLGMVQPPLVIFGLTALAAAVIGIIALVAISKQKKVNT